MQELRRPEGVELRSGLARLRGMSPAALALALLCGGMAGGGGDAAGRGGDTAGRHPQDGPHLDLELRVQGERVLLLAQLNLACADEMVGVLREDEQRLDPVEVEGLREALVEHVRSAAHLTSKGQPLPLEPADFQWFPPDLERLPYYPRFGARALTTLRVELEARADAPPQGLDLTWSSFPPDLIAAADGGEAPPLLVRARVVALGEHATHELTPSAPGLHWEAPADGGRARWLEVPTTEGAHRAALRQRPGLWIGLLAMLAGGLRIRTHGRRGWPLAGAGLAAATAWPGVPARPPLAPEAAREVFLALHANLYSAFEDTREEAIYEGLARAARGDLREELFEHVRGTLTMVEEGGARAEVEALRHGRVELLSSDGAPASFEVEASWEVDGAVHHFGHFHRRTTAYTARYRIEEGPEGWRMVEHRPVDQRRLAVSTNDPGAVPEEEL